MLRKRTRNPKLVRHFIKSTRKQTVAKTQRAISLNVRPRSENTEETASSFYMLPNYGHDTPIPNTQGSCTSVTKSFILSFVKFCQTLYFIATHSIVCTTTRVRIHRLPGRVFTAQPAILASPRVLTTVLLVPREPRRQSQT